MSQKPFWSGVAVGSGAILGAMVLANMRAERSHSRVIRIERSVQIGADVEAVFRAWSHFDRIPQFCRYISYVRNTGVDRSEWTANINGRVVHWEAEVTQVIPNQVIGWKSIDGPKHTGRIFFAPLGSDTLVHVHMNYEPSVFARPVMTQLESQIEEFIEASLRDFKAEMESLEHESETVSSSLREDAELLPPNVTIGNFGQRRNSTEAKIPPRREGVGVGVEDEAATGTHGTTDPVNPVDYTRPPEKNNLRNE